jgi:hypothetical protein
MIDRVSECNICRPLDTIKAYKGTQTKTSSDPLPSGIQLAVTIDDRTAGSMVYR